MNEDQQDRYIQAAKSLEEFSGLYAENDGKVPVEYAIPENLQGILQDMKSTGVPRYEWVILKPFICYMLEKSLDEFRERHADTDVPVRSPAHLETRPESIESCTDEAVYKERKEAVLDALKSLSGAPFTLQRICELILEPQLYYSSVNKLLFGFERLLFSVSTTVDVVFSAPISEARSQEGEMHSLITEIMKSNTIKALDESKATADELEENKAFQL